MPNVLILPRSAEYSEEVWMEIREKALSILHSYFIDGVVPNNAVSDEDEEKNDIGYEDDQLENQVKGNPMQICRHEQQTSESQSIPSNQKFSIHQTKDSQVSGLSQDVPSRPDGRRSRSGKKGKKRPARRRSRQNCDDSGVESSSNYASNREDDNALSGRDQVLSSNSRFASPEDSRTRQINAFESTFESTPEKPLSTSSHLSRRSGELLKDGYVIALHARDRPGLHVSRQRVPGGGWFLDMLSNVTKRDPAAQFLVDFRSKVYLYFFSRL